MNIELLNPELIVRMQTFPWFERCGHEIPTGATDTPFERVPDWTDAKLNFTSRAWEYACQDAGNSLSLYLWTYHLRQFSSCWNDLALTAKEYVATALQPAIDEGRQHLAPTGTSVGAAVAYDVRRIVQMAFVEAGFAHLNHGKTFFNDALRFYELGYFPCGWSGKWPNGHLLIF